MYILGICLGYLLRFVDLPWVLAGLCLCGVVGVLRRRGWRKEGLRGCDLFLIALASFLLGLGRAAWDCVGREKEGMALTDGQGKTTTTLRCQIGPDVTATPLRGQSVRYAFQGLNPVVQAMKGDRHLHYLPLTVHWYAGAEDKHRAPKPGETWQFRGRVTLAPARRSQLPVLTMNTGKNDKRSLRLTTVDKAVWPLRLTQVRQEATRRLALGIEDWGAIPGLNQAMLLGYNSEMPEAMRRIFRDSGTIHVFAVSGMHIVFVAGLLVLLVGMTGLKRVHGFFLVAPLLILYTLITGARPSAVRACVMALFVFLAPLLGRRPTMLSSLVLTAIVVHVWRPDFVFDIGSVLSFGVVAGLIAFMGPFCLFFQRLLGCARVQRYEELLRAAGSTRKAAWVHGGGVVLRFAADSVAVSLAAWLASVPLTGYYFGRFTPGGLFANLVIAPCSGVIVTACTLGWAASYVSEWLAATFNHAAAFLTSIMVRTAEVTAACPGLGFDTGKWAVWQVALWLAGLMLLGGWIYWRQQPADGLAWLTDEGK